MRTRVQFRADKYLLTPVMNLRKDALSTFLARSSGALGEVRKFPQEPVRTRGNTRDRPRKNPNSDELGFWYWWSWRDLNPRPQALFEQFYMCSRLF